ncbi:MAG: hypothetical protein MUO31_14645, partial [Thermodesulfovibrionales bacterium]|nr:hypothetical protein [Thermodesulfovibrionales bacterium]
MRKNISVSPEPFAELQRLVRNVSSEIDRLIRIRVAELRGKACGDDGAGSYEEVRSELTEHVDRVARMIKRLEGRTDEATGENLFESASSLLGSLGIKADYSNIAELTPKFMDAWRGSEEFMHEFITLIEDARDKKDVEKRLREIR